MSAIMTDVIEGTLTPVQANASVNAGGKLLKAVELQLKYGTPVGEKGTKTLLLCGDAGGNESAAVIAAKQRKAALLNELAQLEDVTL